MNNAAPSGDPVEQAMQDPAAYMAQRFGMTETVEGAAFSIHFKCIAVIIVLAITYWAVQALPQFSWASLGTQARWVLGGCVAMVLYTLYHVMVSRSTVSPTQIKQNFVFNRSVHLGEVTFAKFIYIPYLTWLIAPRLFVRTASNKFAAFYGATPELHQAFGRIHRTVADGSR